MPGFLSLLDVTGLPVGSAPAPAATAGFASLLDVTGVAVGVPAGVPPDPQVAEPGTGVLTIVGHAPTIQTPVRATPDVGVLTIVGYAPEILITDRPLIGTGELVLTGYAPLARVSAPCASADSTVFTADLDGPTVDMAAVCIHSETGELILTGYAPTVTIQAPRTISGGRLIRNTGMPLLDGVDPASYVLHDDDLKALRKVRAPKKQQKQLVTAGASEENESGMSDDLLAVFAAFALDDDED